MHMHPYIQTAFAAKVRKVRHPSTMCASCADQGNLTITHLKTNMTKTNSDLINRKQSQKKNRQVSRGRRLPHKPGLSNSQGHPSTPFSQTVSTKHAGSYLSLHVCTGGRSLRFAAAHGSKCSVYCRPLRPRLPAALHLRAYSVPN